MGLNEAIVSSDPNLLFISVFIVNDGRAEAFTRDVLYTRVRIVFSYYYYYICIKYVMRLKNHMW